MAWSPKYAANAYLDTLKLCSKHKQMCNSCTGTEEPESNEFLSALAAGMSAKLIVEVTTEGSPSTVALAAAARQTGGKLVCIIPEPILDKTQKVIQETGLNDMVEFKTGDPVEVLHNYENIDFSLVDGKTDDYEVLMEKLDVNPRRSVVVTNNVQGKKGIGGHLKKVENKVKVRSLQHPIGKGLEVTMIGKSTEFGKKENKSKSGCYSHLIRGGDKKNGHVVKKGDKSKWVFVVDEKSGEEHIYRMPKSSTP
ncbi:uncharacterized protein LOC107031399 isoform X2 [Solanum pennellii]|uniref:Uncharacterized protein LOC107031399 isoform X1 n=1 Tax=Solanum pennellii TaxID=28526 RepID=A0ABM1V253_SOLPN|nr:uncharacterized protein LOC107031399 isoform X1 [Solanum pennellii]XP_027769821.1 uncharacterized protein LOC107031399 isoform X2 [Solanum pennellii]